MIVVDSREPKNLYEALQQLGRVRSKALKYGDYAWRKANKCKRGVERKTLSDLVKSLYEGRLEEQLAGCIESYDQVTLLLEGNLSAFQGGMESVNISVEHFANLLSSISEHGVDLVWSPSILYTPSILYSLYSRDQKEQHTFLRAKVMKPKPSVFHVNDQVAVVMRAWERLPMKVAEELVKRYGGLYGVLQAEERELLKIKGLGKGLIKGLYKGVGK